MRLTRILCVCSVLLVFCETVGAQFLFNTNANWLYRKGQSEASSPSDSWRAPSFDEAAAGFADAPSPFWYGDPYNGGTVLGDMLNSYTCIFLRKKFVVTNIAEVAGLRLAALVDDGFVAWINGVEVARLNVTDVNPTYQTLAANATEPVPFVEYPLPSPVGYLVPGTNVIAVQGFNTSLGSSDFGFNASLRVIPVDLGPPTITLVNPNSGATVTQLTQVTVAFSEPVQGVNADDLLVNGISASSMTFTNNSYTFAFSQPAFYGNVDIAWSSSHGITDYAEPPNLFNSTASGATWSYNLLDQTPPTLVSMFPPPATVLRSLSQVQLIFSEGVANVNASDLLLNGQPATNVVAQPGAVYTFQFGPASAGTATISFATGHGITDVAPAPNAFVPTSWAYVVDPNAVIGDLVINEVNAANENGLIDEDGQQQDWIEIWNRGTNTVNLANWSLSDDADDPGFWTFPTRALGPKQYLIVFASGKDRRPTSSSSNLHTSFSLSTGGEFVGLFSPESPRSLVSALDMPIQRNDVSYGYDAAGQLRYFAAPTPGASNGISTITGVCEPVHFSSSRGFYSQPFDLILSCGTLGATIRYTTNGSEPTLSNGDRYTGPMRVTSTMLLRAAAFRTNLLSSSIRTHSYFFGLTPAQRSLPVISILTAETNLTGPYGVIGISNVMQLGDGSWAPRDATGYHNPSKHGIAWERPVSVEFIRNQDNSGFQADCGIRVQGSDYQRPRTTSTSKFSFRLYFRGDYGSGRLDYPIFPLTTVHRFDQIVLRAGFNDNVDPFVRDELTRRISHDMSDVASHGSLALLYINGVYKGYYNPCERVHEEMLQGYLGGSDDWDVVGPSFATGSGVPGVIDGDRASFATLVNYLNQNDPASAVVYDEIGRRLDLPNFVDYCLLNAYSGMGDWPGNNWRAGKDRGPGGIWRFIVWDGEWAMGIYGRAVTRDSFAENGPGPDNSGLASTSNSEIAQFYQRLRASPEFRLLWADRIHKHMFNGGALTDANITNRFIQMRAEMAGVLPNMATDILNTWVPQRRSVILGHFNVYGLMASSNAPVYNQHGGRVPAGFNLTMQATNGGGTIYYTTNGADPRVKHTGNPLPAAIAYTGPVALSQNTLVKARTLLNGNWSALTESQFTVASAGLPIRFTEISYNPPDGAQYEFIELANVGGAPVDLSGMTLDGITFTFLNGAGLGPGATLILASDRNPAAFAAKYPGVVVAGYFGGSLDNAGERITLKDSAGNIVASVSYDDEGGWPISADGGGRTLAVINPGGDPNDPANWRPSSTGNGDPGVVSPAPALPVVRINEVMAENLGLVSNSGTFPDWIELHNSSASSVSVAGWSITDDGNPRKYVFPAGTTIAAGGYIMLWCDAATNTTPGLHSGFALDADSDNVFLYDPATNRADAVSFGKQVANFAIGRIGSGWELTQPTPAGPNTSAATAPSSEAAVNEWLANPVAGQPDWLEIYNRSSLPLALRGMYLGSTGAVQQIASLAFVPPGGFAQLFCDEGVGWNHLNFKLPASAGIISMLDPLAIEVDRISYTNQAEGVSRGRLPDGSTTFTNFAGSASPGASNYVNTYSGPVVNEVLARNRSSVTNVATGLASDFVELFNGGATPFNIGGMSLSVDRVEPGQFVFPSNTVIAANGYLVIWCEDSLPMSAAPGNFNTGGGLDGNSGAVYLFSPAGQIVNSVEYGFQVTDRPIGRVSGGVWRLVATSTPGSANAAAQSLGSFPSLRINEWMANPAGGDDWFEIFNSTNLPVDLSGLVLIDDPSFLATNVATRLAPLSFIAANGFARIIADGNPQAGRDHVSFSLQQDGDIIRLYRTDGSNQIDSITFGAQVRGNSSGRLPDGGSNIVSFVNSDSPGESNYQLIPNLVINEIYLSAGAGAQWVELRNRTSVPVPIGGWCLSDSQIDFKRYRIPDGTMVPANGYFVIGETQFGGAGAASPFHLNRQSGGEIWLSAADITGSLTGARIGAAYGGSTGNAALGRIENGGGIDYAVLTDPTSGSTNAAPLVGPVVISEIMYHPLSGDEEFIELRNLSGAAVPLAGWRISDGVSYLFLPGFTMNAGAYVVLVGFDPADAARLASFRNRFGVGAAVQVIGPWFGNLDNSGEDLELLRPNDTPGFMVRADRVNYGSDTPWPSGAANGGGMSLQRRVAAKYGNDPENWVTDIPTPGATNGAGTVNPPTIIQAPSESVAYEGTAALMTVAASGAGPLSYQWRLNNVLIQGATNSSLFFDFAVAEVEGQYDVVVSNPGGVAVSPSARLVVAVPPEFLAVPVGIVVPTNSTAQLSVSVRGTQPITYEWRRDGVLLPAETGPVLRRSPAQVGDTGLYEITVSNRFGAIQASAMMTITMPISFLVPPASQTVAIGEPVTLSTVVTGSPWPFNFVWVRSSTRLTTNYPSVAADFYTFTAPTIVTSVQYRVVARNAVNTNGAASAFATITVLADSDGDGIPDAWENNYGLNANDALDRNADSDGDGASNFQEYRSGTNPTNSQSFLRVETLAVGGGATLSFGALSNRTYTIQYLDALADGAVWQRLSDVVARASDRTEIIADPDGRTNRFYRIVTPWQP